MTRPRPPARFSVLTTAILLLAACSSGTPGRASATLSPDASLSPAALDCRPLDLRMPNGDQIDLSGTWEGGSTVHYVRQFGDCVWWIALSNWQGQPLGAFYSMTFSGHITDDFTLRGVEATIVTPQGIGQNPLRQVPVTFTIDLAAATGEEPIVLSRVGEGLSACGCPIPKLHYVGPLPRSVVP